MVVVVNVAKVAASPKFVSFSIIFHVVVVVMVVNVAKVASSPIFCKFFHSLSCFC